MKSTLRSLRAPRFLTPAALAAMVMSNPAFAALDAGVTTAITTAETDLKALLGALIAAGIAVWVVKLIANKFKVKA